MRIVISSMADTGLDSKVSTHFGRCPFFTVVDLEGTSIDKVQAITNPFFPNHSPGQIPQFVKQQNADVMIAGGMGGRAIELFEQFGVQSVTGAAGTVADAVAMFVQGVLADAAPCADHGDHGDQDHERQANCEKH